MKNVLKWPLVALVGAIMLSSCATSNDVVSGNLITKRKYNKGFHLNLNKSYKSTKSIEQEEDVETIAYSSEESTNNAKENEIIINSSITTQEENTQSPLVNETNSVDNVIDSPKEAVANVKAIKEDLQTKPLSKNAQKINRFVKQTKDKQNSSKGSDSDVKLVLLVVLAFIISPLAMYLADGQTDIWFILDLILYLMWFSVFFVANLYLVSLSAIAIALLRIFALI